MAKPDIVFCINKQIFCFEQIHIYDVVLNSKFIAIFDHVKTEKICVYSNYTNNYKYDLNKLY
ncbi:MAG: hypothetical protein ACTTNR_02685 [Arsenophonus sp.]